jgi:hypothetical protein
MRPALAALLGAAALATAGCGERATHDTSRPDTGSAVRETAWTPPPVGSGYAESLAALCARTHAAHDAVGIATDTDILARKLPRTIRIDHRFVAELGRLVAPRPVAGAARQLVRLFDIVIVNEESALLHLRAQNWNGYFIYMDYALKIRLETDALATRLGAPACVFRPFHGA